MTLYALYLTGSMLSRVLPLRISYAIACLIADAYCVVARKDRLAVASNLRAILGDSDGRPRLRVMVREVFRNFAKYLVDFFRFSKVDWAYIERNVTVVGLDNLDAGLRRGKGAIIVSAHIGNWELGGLVTSFLRPPMSAVALTHQDRRINDFFRRQRSMGNLRQIEIGISMRGCFSVLGRNGLLALLGDRDFSGHGLQVRFFGREALMPKGPAVFSLRVGSAIVPTFMIREKDDKFRLIFEQPITPPNGSDEDEAVRSLIERYSSVIERYVRRYPTQWFVFQDAWENGRQMRHNTIV